MSKVNHVRIQDFKVNGEWVAYRSEYKQGVQTLYTTEARHLYNQVMKRCDKDGKFVSRFSTYKDCTFGFTDFQHFAEWCNMSEGYGNKDGNGKLWCLDKDILVPGNKVYSPEFCCFVPEFVNNFLVLRGNARGAYPLGVSKASGRSKRYSSRCRMGVERVHLGNFITPLEAHMAWVDAKSQHLLDVINRYSNLQGSREDVCNALGMRYDLLRQHLRDRRIIQSL